MGWGKGRKKGRKEARKEGRKDRRQDDAIHSNKKKNKHSLGKNT